MRDRAAVYCVNFNSVVVNGIDCFCGLGERGTSTSNNVSKFSNVNLGSVHGIGNFIHLLILDTIVTVKYDSVGTRNEFIDAIHNVTHLVVVGINFGRVETTFETVTFVPWFTGTFVLARSSLGTDAAGRTRVWCLLAVVHFGTNSARSFPTIATRTSGQARSRLVAVGHGMTRILGVAQVVFFTVSFGSVTNVARGAGTLELSRTSALAGRFWITRAGFAGVDRQTRNTVTVVASATRARMRSRSGLGACSKR